MQQAFDMSALMFFEGHERALMIYEHFVQMLYSMDEDIVCKISKTQISFSKKRMFVCVSYLAPMKKTLMPKEYLTISFSYTEPIVDPNIQACVKIRENRYTHHMVISTLEQMDETFWKWICNAVNEIK